MRSRPGRRRAHRGRARGNGRPRPSPHADVAARAPRSPARPAGLLGRAPPGAAPGAGSGAAAPPGAAARQPQAGLHAVRAAPQPRAWLCGASRRRTPRARGGRRPNAGAVALPSGRPGRGGGHGSDGAALTPAGPAHGSAWRVWERAAAGGECQHAPGQGAIVPRGCRSPPASARGAAAEGDGEPAAAWNRRECGHGGRSARLRGEPGSACGAAACWAPQAKCRCPRRGASADRRGDGRCRPPWGRLVAFGYHRPRRVWLGNRTPGLWQEPRPWILEPDGGKRPGSTPHRAERVGNLATRPATAALRTTWCPGRTGDLSLEARAWAPAEGSADVPLPPPHRQSCHLTSPRYPQLRGQRRHQFSQSRENPACRVMVLVANGR
ncbi:uncharacterized protein LOC142360816 [Opisthocomus hoazin]|uniref:uncharacterized protein LOC142360816 n=1 Tax=Opisthocomus hoazin TaxID=30419 RepID=UPI003F53A1AE